RDVVTNTIRAQYGPGWVGGKQVPGYTEEKGVSPTSTTETYVGLKVFIDNWRWAGVPFYLRTGKHLPKRLTEIAIQFKQPPLVIFKLSEAHGQVEPNVLNKGVQPGESISIKLAAKVSGTAIEISAINMHLYYSSAFRRCQ